MELANTLTYYDTVTITGVKRFIDQATGINIIKLKLASFVFFLLQTNKLERSSLANIISLV
jgi:hypothetical protein